MTTINYTGPQLHQGHPHDAGIDLSITTPVTIPVGGHTVVGTGTRLAIPPGHAGMVYVRSSVGFKDHVVLSNGTGIIDAGYTGEIKLSLHNTGSTPVRYSAGQRIAQIVITRLPDVQWVQTPAHVFDEIVTARGAGGFGSTGTHNPTPITSQ